MIQFKDMKEPINSERWLVKQLTHRLDASGGLTTKMETEGKGYEAEE